MTSTTAQYYPIKGVNSQNEVRRRVEQLEKRLRQQVELLESSSSSSGSSSSGPTFGSAEIDFGATPVAEATFTVSAAGVTPSSNVQCFIQADTTADNDADDHRAAGRSFRMVPTPGANSFSLDVQCLLGLCTGAFNLRFSHS